MCDMQKDAPQWSSNWKQAEDLVENNDAIIEALCAFAVDQTGDNAVGLVSTVLDVATQPTPVAQPKTNSLCSGGCTTKCLYQEQGWYYPINE